MTPTDTFSKWCLFGLAVIVAVMASPFAVFASEPSPLTAQRIVSLSLCTDQLLMALVEEKRIAAVSYMAGRSDYSFITSSAKNLPSVSGRAEEVLAKKPDLVVASRFSARATVDLLRRVGETVIELPAAKDLDGIETNLRQLGIATGARAQAKQLIGELQRKFAARDLTPEHERPLAQLIHANGYAPGSNSLADWLVRSAGFRTVAYEQGQKGMQKISFEGLLRKPPDAIIIAANSHQGAARATEVFSHPALKRMRKNVPQFALDARYTFCGTPHITDALGKLIAFRKRVQAILREKKR